MVARVLGTDSTMWQGRGVHSMGGMKQKSSSLPF